MALNALMAVYFGFGSLLLPIQFWELYGLEVEADGIWALRFIGFLVVSNGYLVWFSRGLDSRAGQRLVSNFVIMVWVLYGLISLWGQLAGAFNLLNWSNVIGPFIFAILNYMVRPEPEHQAAMTSG